MLCAICNSTVPEDSIFCMRCGALQEAAHDEVVRGFVQELIGQADSAYRENRYEEAIAAYKKVLDVQPDHEQAGNNLSMLEDEYSAIRDTLEQARLFLAQRKFQEAQTEAWKILEAVPGLREAENIIAQAAASINKFEEAFTLGKECLEVSRWEEALEKFRLAIDINPYAKEVFPLRQEAEEHVKAWQQEVERLESLRESRSFNEAISFAEKMAKRRPFDQKIRNFISDTRETLETLEENRVAGEKALRSERWSEACRAWERVVRILPEDMEARQNLKKAKAEEARARAARIRNIVKLSALGAVVLIVLIIIIVGYTNSSRFEWGKKYMGLGEPAKALKEFERTGSFMVDDDELAQLKQEASYMVHVQEGDTARRGREWAKAKAAYREAASFTSDTGKLDSLMKLIEANETLEAAVNLAAAGKFAEAIDKARKAGALEAAFAKLPDAGHVIREINEAIDSYRIKWLKGARKLLDSDKYLAASVQMRKVLNKCAGDTETQGLLMACRGEWLKHAESIRKEEKWDEALLEYQRMSVAFPGDAGIAREVRATKARQRYKRARELFGRKQYYNALKYAREAEEMTGDIPQLQQKIAGLMLNINAALDQGYDMHMKKAKALLEKGKLKEARVELDKAMLYRTAEEAKRLAQIVDDRLTTPKGMVYIPVGECIIGDSTQVLWKREGPAHRVNVPAYYIDKLPVTNAQYLKFVQATRHRMPAHWVKAGNRIPRGSESHPLTRVNIADAQAYAAWAGKRLPTEVEWERAARGTEGLKYPWGNTYRPGLANDESAGKGGTTPVGAFPDGKSPSGCLDMAGNVWEWTSTKYHLYPGSEEELDPGEEKLCVVKGGCFMDDKLFLRSSFRETVDPEGPYAVRATIGFRCAADVSR